LTLQAGYIVQREGLNGVPDRHERDADALAIDGSLDFAKLFVASVSPRVQFLWRHTWDRGRDVGATDPNLAFDPAVHPFHGTQKRWTAGVDITQTLPRDAVARVAFYRSRLTADDVAATVAKQEGRGWVWRVGVTAPISASSSWTAFVLRGSADDPDTPLSNEGFLGNEQRRFGERGTPTEPDADSVFFNRIASALQVRAVGTAFAPALGLSNRSYAGASWSTRTKIPEAPGSGPVTNPLRNLLWLVKYRAVWHARVGEATGFAGHELAMRVTGEGLTGNGTWAPYAGAVFFAPGAALDSYLSRNVFQVFAGASVKIPLFVYKAKA
jgi:hypothetical protein